MPNDTRRILRLDDLDPVTAAAVRALIEADRRVRADRLQPAGQAPANPTPPVQQTAQDPNGRPGVNLAGVDGS